MLMPPPISTTRSSETGKKYLYRRERRSGAETNYRARGGTVAGQLLMVCKREEDNSIELLRGPGWR